METRLAFVIQMDEENDVFISDPFNEEEFRLGFSQSDEEFVLPDPFEEYSMKSDFGISVSPPSAKRHKAVGSEQSANKVGVATVYCY